MFSSCFIHAIIVINFCQIDAMHISVFNRNDSSIKCLFVKEVPLLDEKHILKLFPMSSCQHVVEFLKKKLHVTKLSKMDIL